jgi:hypothetical protein
MLFMPVLMSLGSGRTNALAIAQWRISGTGCWPWGLAEEKPLRPCPIYRFMWALEQQAVALQLWATDVLHALGQHQEGDCWRSAWMANTSRVAQGIKPSYWSWPI